MRGKPINSGGPGAPTKVPAPGATSSVGPKAPKLKVPRTPNTRDYGKPMPAPSPSPFGPVNPIGGGGL